MCHDLRCRESGNDFRAFVAPSGLTDWTGKPRQIAWPTTLRPIPAGKAGAFAVRADQADIGRIATPQGRLRQQEIECMIVCHNDKSGSCRSSRDIGFCERALFGYCARRKIAQLSRALVYNVCGYRQ